MQVSPVINIEADALKIERLVRIGNTDRASLVAIPSIGEALTTAEIDDLVGNPDALCMVAAGLRRMARAEGDKTAPLNVDPMALADAMRAKRDEWSRSNTPMMWEHVPDAYKAGYMQAFADALSIVAAAVVVASYPPIKTDIDVTWENDR